MSYNKGVNLTVGPRGVGKTYSYKKWCIEDFLNDNEQFVWLRRYKSELPKLKVNFFGDIAHNYPDTKFVIMGDTIVINDKIAGYFVPLSVSSQYKGVPYHFVNKVIFDEFLIENGSNMQYLPNEVDVFLDYVETVGRLREDIRFYLLGNNVGYVNPYFAELDIWPSNNKSITTWPNNDPRSEFLVEYYTSTDEFLDAKEKSRVGRILKVKSDYYNYNVHNHALRGNYDFIEKRAPDSKYVMGIHFNSVWYGFWVSEKQGLMYVDTTVDHTSRRNYSIQKADHKPNIILLDSIRRQGPVKSMVKCFQNSDIRFKDHRCKDAFMQMIKHFVK